MQISHIEMAIRRGAARENPRLLKAEMKDRFGGLCHSHGMDGDEGSVAA